MSLTACLPELADATSLLRQDSLLADRSSVIPSAFLTFSLVSESGFQEHWKVGAGVGDGCAIKAETANAPASIISGIAATAANSPLRLVFDRLFIVRNPSG
jgi:hypothetical protein